MPPDTNGLIPTAAVRTPDGDQSALPVPEPASLSLLIVLLGSVTVYVHRPHRSTRRNSVSFTTRINRKDLGEPPMQHSAPGQFCASMEPGVGAEPNPDALCEMTLEQAVFTV